MPDGPSIIAGEECMHGKAREVVMVAVMVKGNIKEIHGFYGESEEN